MILDLKFLSLLDLGLGPVLSNSLILKGFLLISLGLFQLIQKLLLFDLGGLQIILSGLLRVLQHLYLDKCLLLLLSLITSSSDYMIFFFNFIF